MDTNLAFSLAIIAAFIAGLVVGDQCEESIKEITAFISGTVFLLLLGGFIAISLT